MPGSIAEKYGPHTPGTKRGASETAMWQLDVPQISASRRSNDGAASPASAAPMVPMPPACASIAEVPTAMPAGSPSSAAASAVSPSPTGTAIGSIRVPMRRNPSCARSPRPMAAKNAASQRASWPR